MITFHVPNSKKRVHWKKRTMIPCICQKSDKKLPMIRLRFRKSNLSRVDCQEWGHS